MTKRKMSQDYYQEVLGIKKSSHRIIIVATVLLAIVVIIVGFMFFFDKADFQYGSWIFGGCILVAIGSVAALYMNLNRNIEAKRLISEYEMRENSRKKKKQ